MSFRRKSRELVIQSLYALEYEERDEYLQELDLLNKYEEKLQIVAEENHVDTEKEIYKFAEKLLKGLLPLLSEIDDIINKHSKGWTTERIARVDLCIMRLAVFEMVFFNTPAPVVINESLEITKKFCSETSAPYINAVLDAVHHHKEVEQSNTQSESIPTE
ncbi:MAG TPA: transcription antitermination factor NusB [Candidatus Cloacimonadota bacterium]|jgi:N utilization substance protein B|nr:transcription antitermination factor NusB [Candidatus Cloacimonadota bacterium]HOD54950.1 transcription antitermination factor NusB [Candidatus Cloacimonadota bacterium]HPM00952.1 transcription antitermination factor NusB [Candidatus Cloacimonadota bacterium]